MPFLGHRAGFVAMIVAVPAVVQAQTATATPTTTPTATPTPTPTPTAPDDSAAPAHPVIPATGYGWSDPKPRKASHPPRASRRVRPDSPDAIMPGFEMLADGSTRLFVELSKPVAYETKTNGNVITCVLKGAHVDKRNNYNPLVTVHFNTPVTSARLEPHGRDLWFVVALRAKVQPTVTLDPAKDGSSMLRVEFAKGDYLPSAGPAGSSPDDTPARPQGGSSGH
jgi:hypothetical protein